MALHELAWRRFGFGRSGVFPALYLMALKKAENTRMPVFSEDRFAALKKEYALAARKPSNLRYGYVRAD